MISQGRLFVIFCQRFIPPVFHVDDHRQKEMKTPFNNPSYGHRERSHLWHCVSLSNKVYTCNEAPADRTQIDIDALRMQTCPLRLWSPFKKYKRWAFQYSVYLQIDMNFVFLCCYYCFCWVRTLDALDKDLLCLIRELIRELNHAIRITRGIHMPPNTLF